MTAARNQVVTPRATGTDRQEHPEHEHESALEVTEHRVEDAIKGLWHGLHAAIAPSDSVDE
jgi:hypothetical protein